MLPMPLSRPTSIATLKTRRLIYLQRARAREHAENTASLCFTVTARPSLQMPVNAADAGYGSVPGSGLFGGAGSTETSPLLEPDPEPVQHWQPLNKQQLEAAAGGPGWRKARHYLVLLFWLACIVIFSVAIGTIVMSPRPSATCLRWWQKSLFYQLQADLYMEAQARGPQGAGGEPPLHSSDCSI